MQRAAGTAPRRDARPAAVSIAMVLLAILLLVPACATSGTGREGGDSNLLTSEEIQDANLSTLLQVVQRLRPRWIREVGNRQSFGVGGGIVVYQDQTFLGGPNILSQWTPEMVDRIVYLDGSTAANELAGPAANRHVEGAIILHTH